MTITNLGRGKTDVLFRMVSTLFWTIAYTITLTVIIVICNIDPSIVNDNLFAGVVWSELALVQKLTTLNILLGSTIALGWGALVLDVITAAIKKCCKSRDSNMEDLEEASFWDGAILLEGLKF